MKKFFAIIAVAFASVMVANAQIGIVAGFTSSNAEINTEELAKNLEGVEQYHVGLAFKLPLPLGFAIQPELLYQVKGAELSGMVESANNGEEIPTDSFETKDGFAELGIGIQWGLDLVAFRPFVFAKPFAGISVNSFTNGNLIEDGTDKTIDNAKKDLEYGFSIGAGLELLEHFQLSLEFFKNLGTLFDENGEVQASAEDIDTENLTKFDSYQGFKVTLGFLF